MRAFAPFHEDIGKIVSRIDPVPYPAKKVTQYFNSAVIMLIISHGSVYRSLFPMINMHVGLYLPCVNFFPIFFLKIHHRCLSTFHVNPYHQSFRQVKVESHLGPSNVPYSTMQRLEVYLHLSIRLDSKAVVESQNRRSLKLK